MQQNKPCWSGTAPANIALIKYMGKGSGNVPANPSLSYTTPQFYSTVQITLSDDPQDQMVEKARSDLGAAACARFLAHTKRVKSHLGFDHSILLNSYNNFPMGCGIASSASSFAALTQVLCRVVCDVQGRAPLAIEEVAGLSRLGSGSSCRSFFAPWSVWSDTGVGAIDLPAVFAQHWVVAVSAAHKSVGSSSAHQRVRSSLLFAGRPQRAEQRLEALLSAIQGRRWEDMYHLIWAEFQDMHALFATAMPEFGYMTPRTLDVLTAVQHCWQSRGDGPIVTLDAGPNVHLFFRDDQPDVVQHMQDVLTKTHTILR